MAWDDLEVIRLMQESRMGIYEHVDCDGKYVYFSDIFTDKEYTCLVPAGYYGKQKELWYVRILPAPFNTSNESLVFTTPYVLLAAKRESWIEFVKNRSLKPKIFNPIIAIEAFMKYGPKKYFWNEYIFQSYYHNRSNVIFLAGLPGKRDVASKRKHNPLNVKVSKKSP